MKWLAEEDSVYLLQRFTTFCSARTRGKSRAELRYWNVSAEDALIPLSKQSTETQQGQAGSRSAETLMGFHTASPGSGHSLHSVYNLKSNFLELC